jgi:4-oxalocrotonate tautomerase
MFFTHLENMMPVVRVTWFEGKDAIAKQAVAAEITESIVKHTGTDASYIYVVFEDVKPSDWAGAGKLYG